MNTKSLLLLLALILIAGTIRISGSAQNSFPFMYDHAKDALALLKMSTTREPVLSGAVTSIPGVFNGPAPLYLFLPAFILLGNHPWGAVLTVALSALIAILFLWRKNRMAAFLYAISAAAVGSQTSAWYPYLTGIFMVPLVLILLDLRQRTASNLSLKIFFILGLFIGLLFHAQTAFGMVMLPAVMITLLLNNQSLKSKHWITLLSAFLGAFIPFLLFELRNDFHQFKSILDFLQNFPQTAHHVSPTPQGVGRILHLSQNMLSTFSSSVSPIPLHPILSAALFLVVAYQSASSYRKDFATLWLPLFAIPFLLYLILPFKPYYLVGMIPIFIVWFAETLFTDPKLQKEIVAIPLILICVLLYLNPNNKQKLTSSQSLNTYGAKEAAVLQVIEWSESKPFNSIQLVPEVYDYPYQFLFLKSALENTANPNHFSYSVGSPEYVTEKPELVSKIKNRPTLSLKTFVISEIKNPEDEITRMFPEATIVQSVAVRPNLRVFEIKN